MDSDLWDPIRANEHRAQQIPRDDKVFSCLGRVDQGRPVPRNDYAYQDIAVIMGIIVTGSNMGKETGKILGAISEDEVDAGRPMPLQ